MKNRLIFDTTDAASIADSDSVGAFLRASDGTLLTHTDVGGKKALDVRVAEGINVEVDLNYADDSVTAHQGGTWTVALDSATLAALETINVGNTVTVQATDLDIRNLVFATDKVDVSGSSVSISNSVSVNDAALANTAIANAAKTLAVANTAESVIASALANRKYAWIYNNDNTRIFVGTTGVTATNGFPLSPGSVMELRAGAAVDIKFVGSTGKTPNIRTLELS